MSAFCTIADMEAFLQISIAQLAYAQAAIAEASDAIQRHCRQKLLQVASDAHTFDVRPYRTQLYLPELPVTAIASVVENAVTLVATTDYKLGELGILYRVSGYWYAGVQTVTVTYTHGYAAGDDELETARNICVRAASRRYQAGLRTSDVSGVPGVLGKSLGDYSVTYGGEGATGTPNMLGASAAPILLPSERALLSETYRMVRA